MNVAPQSLAADAPVVITSCFGDRYWAALGPWRRHLKALSHSGVDVISQDAHLHAGEPIEPDTVVLAPDRKLTNRGMAQEAWRARLERVLYHLDRGRTAVQIDVDVLIKRDWSPLCRIPHDFIISRAFGLPRAVLDTLGFVACCGFYIAKPSSRLLCEALLMNIERNTYGTDVDQSVLNFMLCDSIGADPARKETVQVEDIALELDVFRCAGCSVAVLPKNVINRSPRIAESLFGNHHPSILDLFLAKAAQRHSHPA